MQIKHKICYLLQQSCVYFQNKAKIKVFKAVFGVTSKQSPLQKKKERPSPRNLINQIKPIVTSTLAEHLRNVYWPSFLHLGVVL